VGAAALAGGIFGVAGTLCFLLAFGTDYWLVASDDCGPYTWPTQTTLTQDADADGAKVRHNMCAYIEKPVFTNTNADLTDC